MSHKLGPGVKDSVLKYHNDTTIRLGDICEKQRLSAPETYSRFRLSAHSLAVEKGRWNRRGRGRLPMEERLCSCGQVQTEAHVIETCPVSSGIRQLYNITTVNDLMVTRTNYGEVCTVIHKLLLLY